MYKGRLKFLNYIIGRCKSNDGQLAYIDTRIECLEGLKSALQLNTIDEKYGVIELNDYIRLFKGDGPAFEASNQKGGGILLLPLMWCACMYDRRYLILLSTKYKVYKRYAT